MAFAFGKNWNTYLKKSFTEETLKKSIESLQQFLGEESLQGKSFIDFGSGSGVHSLSALKLGASRIVSVDVDKDSVACSAELQKKEGVDFWTVKEGSLLDENFVKTLGTFDMVYCWGVAHHTGDMWKALHNLSLLTSPGGYLFVAIYNTVPGKFGSKTWHAIKKFYNESGWLIKKIMEYGYISVCFLKIILSLHNPFKVIGDYKKKRGMNWKVDLIDWLGGYPYEYATTQEIFQFYTQKHGMELLNVKTTHYIGCNQFLFRKK